MNKELFTEDKERVWCEGQLAAVNSVQSPAPDDHNIDGTTNSTLCLSADVVRHVSLAAAAHDFVFAHHSETFARTAT